MNQIEIFHPGERKVQHQAGAAYQADRIGKSIRSQIPGDFGAFLKEQPFVVISSQDAEGKLWGSLVSGKPGFARLDSRTVIKIAANPVSGDPLAQNIGPGNPVGLLGIELAARIRVRINGTMEPLPTGGFLIEAKEVFGNCPKYIQARNFEWVEGQAAGSLEEGATLTDFQRRVIETADTFFIATIHPDAGLDASHRGGLPGFVRVTDDRNMTFPDYTGNNMFQTLGNITADSRAGLLFLNFETGDTLQMTGTAKVDWNPDRAAEFPGANRVVDFQVEKVIQIKGAMPFNWELVDYSPFNPQ